MEECTLPPLAIVPLYVFVTLAVLMNIAHMLSVKHPKRNSNASDVIQWIKSGVALLILLIVVPLQTSVFSHNDNYTFLAATTHLHHLLVDFYPLGLLALAVTRLRVCLCRGNADYLITKLSALLTVAICFLPLVISVALKSVTSFSSEKNLFLSTPIVFCHNATSPISPADQTAYMLFIVLIFDIIPLILVFILYGVIQNRYRSTELPLRRTTVSVMQRRVTIVQHTRRNGRSIGLSVCLLAAVVVTAWVPYVALKLVFLFHLYVIDERVHHIVSVFVIVFLYLLSPIAEGMFLRQKRDNFIEHVRHALEAIQARIRIDALTDRNPNDAHNMASPISVINTTSLEPGEPQEAFSKRAIPDGLKTPSPSIPLTGESERKKMKVCFTSVDHSIDTSGVEQTTRRKRKSSVIAVPPYGRPSCRHSRSVFRACQVSHGDNEHTCPIQESPKPRKPRRKSSSAYKRRSTVAPLQFGVCTCQHVGPGNDPVPQIHTSSFITCSDIHTRPMDIDCPQIHPSRDYHSLDEITPKSSRKERHICQRRNMHVPNLVLKSPAKSPVHSIKSSVRFNLESRCRSACHCETIRVCSAHGSDVCPRRHRPPLPPDSPCCSLYSASSFHESPSSEVSLPIAQYSC